MTVSLWYSVTNVGFFSLLVYFLKLSWLTCVKHGDSLYLPEKKTYLVLYGVHVIRLSNVVTLVVEVKLMVVSTERVYNVT